MLIKTIRSKNGAITLTFGCSDSYQDLEETIAFTTHLKVVVHFSTFVHHSRTNSLHHQSGTQQDVGLHSKKPTKHLKINHKLVGKSPIKYHNLSKAKFQKLAHQKREPIHKSIVWDLNQSYFAILFRVWLRSMSKSGFVTTMPTVFGFQSKPELWIRIQHF
jgi:hypothetical protein